MVACNSGNVSYTLEFLKRKRFANRHQFISDQTMILLMRNSIFRYFNRKRGARGGKSLKRFTELQNKINVIQTVSLGNKTNYCSERRIQFRGSIKENNIIISRSLPILKSCFPVIFLTNIRAIGKKFDCLRATVANAQPDVMIITETWITCNTLNAYSIENYVDLHKIRTRQDKHHGGGVTVYVNSAYTIHSSNSPKDTDLEILTVIFKHHLFPRTIPFICVIAIYFPPSDVKEVEYIDYVSSEIDRILTINSRAGIFLLGDFNDLNINFLLKMKSFKQIVNHPTRGNNTIDLCFTNVDYNINIEMLGPISNSDHDSILMSPVGCQQRERNKVVITTRKRDKSCFISMGHVLSSVDWSNWNLIVDIELASSLFHNLLRELYENCFPEKKIKKTITFG